MKAIFTKPFSYSSRRVNAGWSIQPSTKPQNFPREVVEAAIDAGCAQEAKRPEKE